MNSSTINNYQKEKGNHSIFTMQICNALIKSKHAEPKQKSKLSFFVFTVERECEREGCMERGGERETGG